MEVKKGGQCSSQVFERCLSGTGGLLTVEKTMVYALYPEQDQTLHAHREYERQDKSLGEFLKTVNPVQN